MPWMDLTRCPNWVPKDAALHLWLGIQWMHIVPPSTSFLHLELTWEDPSTAQQDLASSGHLPTGLAI